MRYDVKKVIDKKIPVYAVYGKDDGLFNQQHLDMIKTSVGAGNYIIVDNASHNVFIDQREEFIKQVKKWLTPVSAEPVKKNK